MFENCGICQEETNEEETIAQKTIGAPPILLKELLHQCFEDKGNLPNDINNNENDTYICNICEDKLLEFYLATLNVINVRKEFQQRVKQPILDESCGLLDDFDTDWSSDESIEKDVTVDSIYMPVKLHTPTINLPSDNSTVNIQLKSVNINRYCSDCEVEFPTEEVYKLHLKKIHPKGVLGKLNFYCTDCCIKISSEELYKVHMQHVHKRCCEFRCTICGRSFNTNTQLVAHTATHKDHTCTICGKSLTHRRGLLRHMETHSAEKNHQCADCGNKYTTRSSLRKHMMVHNGIKNFACTICGSRFRSSWHLKRHYNTHSQNNDIKSQKCSICTKPFAAPYDLRAHLTEHQHHITENKETEFII